MIRKSLLKRKKKKSISVELFPTQDPQNTAEKRALDDVETVSQEEVLLFYKHTMLIAIYLS